MLTTFDYGLEKIDRLETNHVKILYYDLPKNYSGEYKSYQYTRFCTILNGKKEVTLNTNEKFIYDVENYLLLAPHTKVHMDIPEETKALVFEMNDDLIQDVLSKVDLSDQLKEKITINDFFLGENKFHISEDIQNIFNASKNKDANHEFLIDLYAQKLVYDLIQNKAAYHILHSGNIYPIQEVIQYIEENIHSKINLEELAQDLNMSLSNLSHIFKKNTGINPTDFIKNKKLDMALKYLPNESVTDVAYNLGYDNISYFIKLFKRKYKMTPKQYKLKYCK